MTPRNGTPTRTIAFETLGCKLNQYETDSIATTLKHRGYQVVPLGPGADAYVINSCTVTNKADRKSRNTLYRAERLADAIQDIPGTSAVPVILTGCFVDSHPDFDRSTRRTTYLVDNEHKNTIPELLDAHFQGETVSPEMLSSDVFGFETPERVFHTRTNIKVQDGCDNFCTFCIIPRVRGRARSRPLREVVREAGEAINGGSRELVFTGVNMSRYRDGEADFVDLVQAVLDLPGEFRVRISSLEPDGLDDRFVALFDHPRMCPHLHLCLQSGSDRILLRMRRMYTREAYRDLATRLRRRDRFFNLTTDIIVGFPGETDTDLSESVQAVREFRLGHVHLFPFSIRTGTRAERMPGAIDNGEKRRRSEIVQAVALEEKRRYRESLIGRTETVLVEKMESTPAGPVGYGLGRYYAPVRFTVPVRNGGAAPALELHANRFYDVEITAVEEEGDDPHLIGICRS